MKIISTVLSDVGRKREHNEDSYLVDAANGLYAVADGMGGHAAGEVASGLAIDVLKKIPHAVRSAKLVDTHDLIHRVLLRNMNQHQERYGMGTTLTAVLIVDSCLYVAHAGDSACYLIRERKATRITENQSAGHMLLNCLGASEGAFTQAQYVQMQLQPHDVLVLCSDGLTNYLRDDQHIAELLRGREIPFGTLEECAGVLVDHALASGGQDNVTVVCIDVS